jgi:hypothetical protein
MSDTAMQHPVNQQGIPAADNIYIHELMDVILMQAAQIAKESGEHSADQLLLAAGFYMPGELPRLQTRKPNA